MNKADQREKSQKQDLKDKKALVFGIANDKSIAWGIAKALRSKGCDLGLSCFNDKLKHRVLPLAESLEAKFLQPVDVNQPLEVQAFFQKSQDVFGHVDILIHSLAYAQREDLEGRLADTCREGFVRAMETSVYSLIHLAKCVEPLMKNGGRIMTLSYLGATRVIPQYKVMGVAKAALEASVRYLAYELGPKGICVNAISAGPVKTLSAMGIKDFRTLLEAQKKQAPLRENITIEDIGEMAAYLCGRGGRHITGTTLFLDSGSHIL